MVALDVMIGTVEVRVGVGVDERGAVVGDVRVGVVVVVVLVDVVVTRVVVVVVALVVVIVVVAAVVAVPGRLNSPDQGVGSEPRNEL